MEINGITQSELQRLMQVSKSYNNLDNKAKDVMSQFEKMIMKMMLQPLEKSLLGSGSHFAGVSMEFVMDNLAEQFANEYKFGLEKYYQDIK